MKQVTELSICSTVFEGRLGTSVADPGCLYPNFSISDPGFRVNKAVLEF
jgi:hypothetical protein